MSIKRDYTDSSLTTRYKQKVSAQTLSRVSVESDEKRTRAELLDSIESLFEGQQKRLNTESLRAILHILVKSLVNSSDDDTGGATADQVSAINANTAKTSFPGFGTSSSTALRGDTTTISTAQANAITANTAKTGISTSQASAITANTAKVGITTSQSNAITANSAKVGITTAQANAITANTAKVSQGLNTANSSMTFDILESRGSYGLRINVVCDDGATRTFTTALR